MKQYAQKWVGGGGFNRLLFKKQTRQKAETSNRLKELAMEFSEDAVKVWNGIFVLNYNSAAINFEHHK